MYTIERFACRQATGLFDRVIETPALRSSRQRASRFSTVNTTRGNAFVSRCSPQLSSKRQEPSRVAKASYTTPTDSMMAPPALTNDTDAPVQRDMAFPADIPESRKTAANIAAEKLFSLKDSTFLVTGGGRGLGITLARGVIEAGGHAACMDILPEPAKDEWADLQAKAKLAGLTATYVQCDIAKEEDMRAAVEDISQQGRKLKAPLKGVIGCAGIQQKIPILEYPVADFERMFKINTTGAFVTAKVVANDMVKNNVHGSIVLIASMSGNIANRGLRCSAYNSSKAAVHQLCRSMAQEVGEKGIRVNTLSPGVSLIITTLAPNDRMTNTHSVHPHKDDRRAPGGRAGARKAVDGRRHAWAPGCARGLHCPSHLLGISGQQFHDRQ